MEARNADDLPPRKVQRVEELAESTQLIKGPSNSSQSSASAEHPGHEYDESGKLLPSSESHHSLSEEQPEHAVILSVALEAAFPQCAIIRLEDGDATKNCELLSLLQDGTVYEGGEASRASGGYFTAGSRAEGLAMEKGWGHPEADQDVMWLNGGPFGVHVPSGCPPPGRAVLVYRPTGCPPAYCKIQITDPQPLMYRLDASCIHNSGGIDWLHTNNTLKRMHEGSRISSISGPAGQSDFYDFVPTLVCSDAHPEIASKYVHKLRHAWPSSQQLEVIKKLPMLLVLVGYKNSDEFPMQARLSWSLPEIVLIAELPQRIKQSYIGVKYMLKYLTQKLRVPQEIDDGRSRVGSYHLKMVFLHHLEKRPSALTGSQLRFMLDLLHDLDDYLDAGKLPHYFLPDCDLLVTVGHEERHITRRVIKNILCDPIHAILMCPTDPQDIYGEVRPDDLVAAFHRVTSQSTCAKSREDLLGLLGRLDEKRQRRYHGQREKDERHAWSWRVSGRPELTGLVDILEQKQQ